jgi:hypothetical protein
MSDQYGVGPYNPMPGEPYRGPIVKGPAPAPVTNAVRLMFVSVALSVLGLIVVLATKDSLKKDILKKHTDYSATKLDDVLNAAIVFAVVIGVVYIVLYVLLALQVGKGKNWARIVTWVLAGLGVLGALTTFSQPGTAANRVLTVIGGLIDVAIIVFLMQKPSNEYFRKRV